MSSLFIQRAIFIWLLVIGLGLSFYFVRDLIDDIRWLRQRRIEKKDEKAYFEKIEEFRHDFD